MFSWRVARIKAAFVLPGLIQSLCVANYSNNRCNSRSMKSYACFPLLFNYCPVSITFNQGQSVWNMRLLFCIFSVTTPVIKDVSGSVLKTQREHGKEDTEVVSILANQVLPGPSAGNPPPARLVPHPFFSSYLPFYRLNNQFTAICYVYAVC